MDEHTKRQTHREAKDQNVGMYYHVRKQISVLTHIYASITGIGAYTECEGVGHTSKYL
jgi:hypothetical protein